MFGYHLPFYSPGIKAREWCHPTIKKKIKVGFTTLINIIKIKHAE